MAARRRKIRYRLKNTKKARIQAFITLLGCMMILGGLVHTAMLLLPPDYLDAGTSDIDGIPLYTDFLDEAWRGRHRENNCGQCFCKIITGTGLCRL